MLHIRRHWSSLRYENNNNAETYNLVLWNTIIPALKYKIRILFCLFKVLQFFFWGGGVIGAKSEVGLGQPYIFRYLKQLIVYQNHRNLLMLISMLRSTYEYSNDLYLGVNWESIEINQFVELFLCNAHSSGIVLGEGLAYLIQRMA